MNGAGGGDLNSFDDPIPGSMARFSDDHGAMFIDATQTEIVFRFVTRTGLVVDEYTLGGGAGKSAVEPEPLVGVGSP
ncbi:MAG: hypothetical protein L0206_11880 [Actinobacteria bacterium]|nr:hypothetical protein [Actinomycetota bacterium]